MTLYEELKARGLVAQITDEEIIDLINNGKATFYIGFDCTADSLTAGHFLALTLMKRLQLAGNKPIALIGGGTTMIGDPSGRTDMRKMLTKDDIAHNAACFKKQMEKFIDFSEGKALMLNNADWLLDLNYVELLREVGACFSVNNMLRAECYKQRMEKGLSFLEFNYMIMQSYDFYYMFQHYGCNMQFGGDDQWSNMLGGTELIRRKLGNEAEAFAITCPLITKADGTKFGKTAGGAVWLDPKKTSPYEFYQFWFNQDDRDVVKYLKYFTFLSKEEIDALDKEVQAHPENRTAQKRLAEEITRFVHGEEGLAQALKVTAALFSGDIAELTGEEIEGAFRNTKGGEVSFAPVNIVDALVEAGVEKSKRQAREDITNGAVRVNGMQIKDTEASISAHPNTNGRFIIIRKGKKNYFSIAIKE